MSDAIKNVTIRLSVVRGTIEPINASFIKDATSAYVELAKAEKSVVEQQMAVVEASKQVNQAQKSAGETARTAAQSTVTSNEAQFASSEKRRAEEETAERKHVDKILETRRPLREPGIRALGTPGALNVTEPGQGPGQQNRYTLGTDTGEADAQQLKEISASIEEELDSQRADRERKERETENRIQAERQRAAAESFAAEQQRLAQANEIELQASRMRIQQDQEERKLEEALLAEEEAANEKALAKQAADEMKFRQNMRDQQIKEEAETEKANERQAASELKFRQDMRNQRIKEEAAEEQAKERQGAAELKFFQNMRDQRIKEEETAAEAVKKQEAAVLEFRSRMNQQRLKEEETTANEVAQARGRMPGLQRGALQDVTQTIAAVGTLTSHLSMLKSIGGDSLEDIAKKFAKVQSTIGIIGSTQSVFSNIGEGLGKLQKMGDSTAILVAQQKALGVATTFSQTATLRLAGAAGVAQAAMGPVALIATGIMAALAAAEIAMSMFGETSEDVARKNEEFLKRQNDEMQKGIDLLTRQKDVMEEQLAIVEQQWETKRLLAGDDGVTMGDMMKENEATRARRDAVAEKSLKEKFGESQKTGMTDEQKSERARIDSERKNAEFKLKNAEEWEKSRDGRTVQMGIAARESAESDNRRLDRDEAKLNAEINTPTASAIAGTKIKDGLIVDFDSFNKNLQALPANMKEAATGFVKELSQQQREMFDAEKAALSAANSAFSSAKSDSSQAVRAIDAEKKRFGGEQEFAARFGLTDSKYAMKDAEDALNRFDSATSADDKEAAAKEAEDILRKQGLLSTDADALLSGSSRDSKAFRMQLKDDSEIDKSEITASDTLVATQTDNKMKADAIIAQGEKVAKDLKERLRAIDAQQQQLLQILDNRL